MRFAPAWIATSAKNRPTDNGSIPRLSSTRTVSVTNQPQSQQTALSTSDRAVRPMVSSVPSVDFLERRKVFTTTEGQVLLRAGTELTTSQRQEAEGYAEQLRSSLQTAATEAEVGRAVVMLLAPYEARERSNGANDLRLAAYVQALQGFPLWAILDAVRWWSRGEHGVETDNVAFAPAPPQVVRLVRIAMRGPEDAHATVEGLLRAEVEDWTLPPKPGERERIAEGFASLAAELGNGVDEEKKKALKLQREHILKGNEMALRKDYEAHGIEYEPGNLRASPSLLAALKARQQQEAAE